jgi:hypothetical protein
MRPEPRSAAIYITARREVVRRNLVIVFAVGGVPAVVWAKVHWWLVEARWRSGPPIREMA